MIAPTFPQNEAARLAALRALEVLDSAPEAAFERIAQLACRVFEVPMALISLVDEHRQWNKACIGMDVREVDRRLSFCAHAILSDGPLVVPDTLLDERFADSPFVTAQPHVRFYAGAALEADGHKLGTLCIMDTRPHTNFSEHERANLADLAHAVTDALELRRANARSVSLEAQVRTERRLLEETFSALESGVVVQDATGSIVAANDSAARILGLSMDQLMGRTSLDPRWRTVHTDGSPFPGSEHPVSVALRDGVAVSDVTMGVYRPDGSLAWVAINARPLWHDQQARPYAAVGSFTDITERVRHQSRLEHMVYHDGLTGLPNRAAFLERLNALHGSEFAVGFLDLDSFKEVNDRHGHEAGDELLKSVATRIKARLRGEDVIARLAGDEFALLLHGVTTTAHATNVTARIFAALEPPVLLRDGTEVRPLASIGFAFYPHESEDGATLLRLADARMYDHKGNKRREHALTALR